MLNTQLVSAAWAGTSFDPERRAQQMITNHEAELANVRARMEQAAKAGGTLDLLDDVYYRYVGGLNARTNKWLAAHGRCVSWMITGRSNFNVGRAEKRNAAERARSDELSEYRTKGLAKAMRELRPDLAPIRSGDDNAVDRLAAEIAKAEEAQAKMKAANAAIRKAKAGGAPAQIAALVELGFPERVAEKLVRPDFAGRIGFADYQLTNNGANIRRLRARMVQVSAAKAAPVVEVDNESTGIRVEDDPPANRIRIYFPGKPDAGVRDGLKKNGFRWAPSVGAWQAYRNSWSIAAAKNLINNEGCAE